MKMEIFPNYTKIKKVFFKSVKHKGISYQNFSVHYMQEHTSVPGHVKLIKLKSW